MFKLLKCVAVSAVAAAAALPASALARTYTPQMATLYDNGMADPNAPAGYASSELRGWRVFDNFTLASDSIVQEVFFQQGLTSGDAFNGSFTFSVFAFDSNSNSIGGRIFGHTLMAGDYTATPNELNAAPMIDFYDVSFSIPDLALTAGDYALSFLAHGQMDFRSPTVGGGDSFIQHQVGGGLHTRQGDTPFRLRGRVVGETSSRRLAPPAVAPVPAPASLPLFIAALSLFGFLGLRKRA